MGASISLQEQVVTGNVSVASLHLQNEDGRSLLRHRVIGVSALRRQTKSNEKAQSSQRTQSAFTDSNYSSWTLEAGRYESVQSCKIGRWTAFKFIEFT